MQFIFFTFFRKSLETNFLWEHMLISFCLTRFSLRWIIKKTFQRGLIPVIILLQYKHIKKHAMQLCYCFGYGTTVRFIEMWMFHAWALNRKWCKVKFISKYLSWIGTNPVFIGCTRNLIWIAFVETPRRSIWKWTNSNIRHSVTDGPFSTKICQGCMFDPKEKNPYWCCIP